ncbi:hypothetical protein BDV06DRAFT_229806 [Aspergillus oleicola]
MTPTIVLVHGAWHYPAHYRNLTSALSSLGHEVFVPTLLTMNGACPPTSDLYTDTDHIHSYVESLADTGHKIVVLMHSYGGQVGTNALDKLDVQSRKAQNLPGGVVRLIYLCAMAFEEGGSMYKITAAVGRAQNLLAAMDINEDGTAMYRNAGERMLGPYSGLSKDEVEAYTNSLGVWNVKGMYGELMRCAWREIPVSYVKVLQDLVMPTPYQTRMIEVMRAAGREVEVFELDTGHSPQTTMTQEVTEIVHGIVCRVEE